MDGSEYGSGHIPKRGIPIRTPVEPKDLQRTLDQTVEVHLQKLFDDLHACCVENGIPTENMAATLADIELATEFDHYTQEL